MKLDDRILRHFKIGVFVGVRRVDDGLHRAFFINGKEANRADLGLLLGGLRALPEQVRRAYSKVANPAAKDKKRRRRKKNPKSSKA
ncbi:MAG: hypothetical protein U1G07_15115 [Verrucomicrobiota bacterium]